MNCSTGLLVPDSLLQVYHNATLRSVNALQY